MLNLTSFIRFHARRSPDALALIYGDTRLGYATFLGRIERTAGLLAARGIGPGDIVAVVMKNSAAFIETRLRDEPRRRGLPADQLPPGRRRGQLHHRPCRREARLRG